MSAKLVVSANITIVPLPPKCPELNAQENIWQNPRENWLSNRVFTSHNDIVDRCAHAWTRDLSFSCRLRRLGRRPA